MKGSMSSLLSIIIGLLIGSIISCAYISEGVPFTWTLSGEFVSDPAYYTGGYYSVNDSLRIVVVEDEEFHTYDQYVVCESKNNKWVKTGADAYVSMFNSRAEMLLYVRGEYAEYKREQKNKLTPFH